MSFDKERWPTLRLDPEESIQNSLVYQDLKKVRLEVLDGRRYALACHVSGLKFCVDLTGILSSRQARRHRFQHQVAVHNLRKELEGERGTALFQFVRYSPWLIPDLEIEGGPLRDHVQDGAVIARLIELLQTLLEEKGWAAEQLRESYWLLLRARFLILTELSQTPAKSEARDFLPDLDHKVREAWHAWGQNLYRSPQDIQLLLDRCGRHTDSEGARLLFADEEKRQLWPFATTDADRSFTHQLLRRWFLPRYDLPRVMRALSQLPGRRPALRQALPIMQFVVSVVAVVGLSLPLAVGGFVAPGGFAWRALGGFANLMAWFAVLLAMGAILTTILLDFDPVRYSLPRITSAIFVGYIALVSSSEIMAFAVQAYDQHLLLAWAAVAGSILLAFGAIYVEARRRLREGRMALGRAGLVLLIAAARSVTLGWLILAPAGELLLHGNDVLSGAKSWPGMLGLPIYPQLIFILAPLALFIGIFVQTIWEEYPLTHPL